MAAAPRAPRPDLRMVSVAQPPASTHPGASFIVRDAVGNDGSRTAAASRVRYYLRSIASRTSVRLDGSRRVGRLAPGRRSRGQRRVGIPVAAPVGTYRLVACADDTRRVPESNERNNCRAAPGVTRVVARIPGPSPQPPPPSTTAPSPQPPPQGTTAPSPQPPPQGTTAPSATVDSQPPAAPSNLAATAGDGSASLSWNANQESDLAGYRVYRRNPDGWPSTPLATLAKSTTSYTDPGLRNGTPYTYRVTAFDQAGNESAASNEASATPTAPMIAAAGDIACDPADANYNSGAGTSTACRQRFTSDLLTGGNLAAVLPLGDEQYGASTLSNFQRSYDPSWGRVVDLTHPAPGNHEYSSTPNAEAYFAYFNGRAGDPSKGYYSYDIGPWHLVALNSSDGCTPAVVPCAAGSPQEQWLRGDLAAHANQCVLAYWHHPLFTSGTAGPAAGVKPLWQALYDYHADVVLNGHQHSYERYEPLKPDGSPDLTGGIREFVVGTGGKSHQGFGTTPKPTSEDVRDDTTFGILNLTLHASSYDWKFQPDPGSGAFTDGGHAACHHP